ncbi:2-succinyl-6-hydroxy-2,4-cyclohexadiene-1-carboxylate synthase [Vibrio penaeicida]|uniref:2-succinyl-6-hydroxy-2, 4-cyclohexadiene-1-carboxylate synthase n=1 Tax=Vibrio penaeicida TaxID=104609 RepID=UPI002733F4D5|nr:2-succinyl-6-hydroxy-2,4-cyclohexadiene-1-carboxylate synthase [Vibrio penaeicida]MDP2570946.1 2-succinyl-6-hydroxy-2,4-cyclohexadiene-1-carboxylate synthase [Vibrio penaeicida]
MHLGSQWLAYHEAHVNQPVVVFLHGFLGNAFDWQTTSKYLNEFNCLGIDLAGHGRSATVTADNFSEACEQVNRTLKMRLSQNTPIILVGYSLGARIAMSGLVNGHWDRANIVKVVLEGGHFGLESELEKDARWKNDLKWAKRFANEDIEQVLQGWYQQPVFNSLNHEQRQSVINQRRNNNTVGVSRMLCATSLAKQPYLLDEILRHDCVQYVCGDKDEKFKTLAESSGLTFSLVKNAGHNVHQEQPAAFAQIINQCVTEYKLQS